MHVNTVHTAALAKMTKPAVVHPGKILPGKLHFSLSIHAWVTAYRGGPHPVGKATGEVSSPDALAYDGWSQTLNREYRTLRPKLQGYTGCKRTCAVEQSVSCI